MSESRSKEVFNSLFSLDVNEHVEQKNTGKATLSYLSWAWAWAEVKKRYPDASYKIIKDENNLPYFSDEKSGIICYTEVTIDGVTHEMWLPVMDGANNAMRFEPYSIKTRFGDKSVAAATMFDINKTIMRCLTKNLAMFGLGLYIYAGEDLPEESEDVKLAKEKAAEEIKTLIENITAIAEKKTAKMTKDEKMAFATNEVKPIVGMLNYKMCTDKAKLEKLLAHLSK